MKSWSQLLINTNKWVLPIAVLVDRGIKSRALLLSNSTLSFQPSLQWFSPILPWILLLNRALFPFEWLLRLLSWAQRCSSRGPEVLMEQKTVFSCFVVADVQLSLLSPHLNKPAGNLLAFRCENHCETTHMHLLGQSALCTSYHQRGGSGLSRTG